MRLLSLAMMVVSLVSGQEKRSYSRPGSGHRQGTLAGRVGGCDVGAILCGIERQLDSGDPRV